MTGARGAGEMLHACSMRRTRSRRVGAVALLAGLALAASFAQTAPALEPGTRLIGATELRELLAAHRAKVVLVNFWATWCVPCLREIPDLQRLERELDARGFALVTISMDEPGDIARVEAFRAGHFPQLATALRTTPDMDAIASVLDPAWNEILPTSWLVGRDGKVIRRVQGRRSYEEFRALVEKALAAPPGGGAPDG